MRVIQKFYSGLSESSLELINVVCNKYETFIKMYLNMIDFTSLTYDINALNSPCYDPLDYFNKMDDEGKQNYIGFYMFFLGLLIIEKKQSLTSTPELVELDESDELELKKLTTQGKKMSRRNRRNRRNSKTSK